MRRVDIFYRPPGGGIEFQEHSRDAARRELHEEFDLELRSEDLTLLGVIENIFDFGGEPHHEICFIYEARVSAAVLDLLDGVASRCPCSVDPDSRRVQVPRCSADLLLIERGDPVVEVRAGSCPQSLRDRVDGGRRGRAASAQRSGSSLAQA